jgi:predicted ATPase
MKITVRNLGAIKEAEFDLKPLTILIGPNNAGKTWLAYTLAGIFGPYSFSEYSDEYIEEDHQEYPLLDEVIEAIASGKNAIESLDLVEFVEVYGEKYFNNIAHETKYRLCEFLSSRFASFKDTEIRLDLTDMKSYQTKQIKNIPLRSEITSFKKKPLLKSLKRRGAKNLYVYLETVASDVSAEEDMVEEVMENIPREVVKELLVRQVFMAMHRTLYPHVRIFPTERTTFIAFPFPGKGEETVKKQLDKEPQMLHENSLQEHPSRQVIGPVSSFLSMIEAIYELDSADLAQRDEATQKNPKIKEYVRLADLLETEILGGKTDLSPAGSSLFREVLFHPSSDKKLEISITSSMIKELAPLVLYLRYLARPGELLIIDEPEMNLHPEAQAKIIEFLAMLVNAGLHVLVTTHSPYMVDHLLNLRKAREHEDQEAVSDRFFLRSKDAFIGQQESVVYLVDQGKIKNLLDENQEDDEEQEEDTFGKISDRISEIYFTL